MSSSTAYISAQQAAIQWGISKRRVQTLCSARRIPEAVRIGNMWVVPEKAQKPPDARRRAEHQSKKISANPIKIARKTLKTLSITAYRMAEDNLHITSEAKKNVIALFANELLNRLLSDTPNVAGYLSLSQIRKLLDIHVQVSDAVSHRISKLFKCFTDNHPFCLDDALSWAYQFINKVSLDTGLESTQFFTEKYMITTLVDQCGIENTSRKILDPACGGGSFLIYALDYLCDNAYEQETTVSRTYIKAQLNRLYGYDLDATLSIIASINIRLKVLTILKDNGHKITADDFFSYEPKIYHSKDKNIMGALDPNTNIHKVIQAGTHKTVSLEEVFISAQYIFTNPPFQTVKGMDNKQKEFLKDNYPNSKCDMCNAFIELAVRLLDKNGICGMVTQTSWMYLDSFADFRTSFLQMCSIVSIVELGSNAFYDISGEKANVALLSIRNEEPDAKTTFTVLSLKHLVQSEMESQLSYATSEDVQINKVYQSDIYNSSGYRFGFNSNNWAQELINKYPRYGDYATPMQGTSTGDSKSLVGYFWEHIGDNDWCLVSKGGGYSRWFGLNSYAVKWGENGEYIKDTPGSAIRNAKYFGDTQMVFSDTGTAGLNVRLLVDNQIFIASGPGIRTTYGETLTHIAFLNSRFSSYFMKLLSPKLTIAAGYIAKIPVIPELFASETLKQNARICIDAKQKRLQKRPINYEYISPVNDKTISSLDDYALCWLLGDIEEEWVQLCTEHEIDKTIIDTFKLSEQARKEIDTLVGRHALDITDNQKLSIAKLDQIISELLDENCMLKRTRPSKNHLGCDGFIEYIAHMINLSPNSIYESIVQRLSGFTKTLEKYRETLIHNIVLSSLGYTTHSLPDKLPKKINVIIQDMTILYPCLINELPVIERWILNRLNTFHNNAFWGKPIIQYSAQQNAIGLIR